MASRRSTRVVDRPTTRRGRDRATAGRSRARAGLHACEARRALEASTKPHQKPGGCFREGSLKPRRKPSFDLPCSPDGIPRAFWAVIGRKIRPRTAGPAGRTARDARNMAIDMVTDLVPEMVSRFRPAVSAAVGDASTVNARATLDRTRSPRSRPMSSRLVQLRARPRSVPSAKIVPNVKSRLLVGITK